MIHDAISWRCMRAAENIYSSLIRTIDLGTIEAKVVAKRHAKHHHTG